MSVNSEPGRISVERLPSLQAPAKRAMALPDVADVIGPTVTNVDQILRGLIDEAGMSGGASHGS